MAPFPNGGGIDFIVPSSPDALSLHPSFASVGDDVSGVFMTAEKHEPGAGANEWMPLGDGVDFVHAGVGATPYHVDAIDPAALAVAAQAATLRPPTAERSELTKQLGINFDPAAAPEAGSTARLRRPPPMDPLSPELTKELGIKLQHDILGEPCSSLGVPSLVPFPLAPPAPLERLHTHGARAVSQRECASTTRLRRSPPAAKLGSPLQRGGVGSGQPTAPVHCRAKRADVAAAAVPRVPLHGGTGVCKSQPQQKGRAATAMAARRKKQQPDGGGGQPAQQQQQQQQQHKPRRVHVRRNPDAWAFGSENFDPENGLAVGSTWLETRARCDDCGGGCFVVHCACSENPHSASANRPDVRRALQKVREQMGLGPSASVGTCDFCKSACPATPHSLKEAADAMLAHMTATHIRDQSRGGSGKRPGVCTICEKYDAVFVASDAGKPGSKLRAPSEVRKAMSTRARAEHMDRVHTGVWRHMCDGTCAGGHMFLKGKEELYNHNIGQHPGRAK